MRAGGRKRAKGPGRPARAPGPISTPPASPGAPREADLARLQELLAKAPGDTRVLNNLAVTLRALGRRDEATRHLERAAR